MKYKLLLIFILLLLPFCFARSKIEVLKVYDGDTILAKIDNNIFRIRLKGIDCFEGKISKRAELQAKANRMNVNEIIKYGNQAGGYLRNLLNDKEVYFEFQGIDKYSRALGVLYVNNEDINKKMLEYPYCMPY